MSTITLLTDFGLADAWAGIMKGVILGINPDARIVDLSHQVPPQDVEAAAWTIAAAYPYFAPGTVHVIVVDPGVGSDRNIICARCRQQFFVAPDNGVLSAVLESDPDNTDVRIAANRELFLDTVSNTFHGRDVLAPVGAHLTLSQDIAATGPAAGLDQLVYLKLPKPVMTATGELEGEVIRVDHFGNLITNINRSALEALQLDGGGRLEISLGTHAISGLKEAYVQGGAGRPMAIFGSTGYLEIAIFGKSAHRELNLNRGDPVRVSVSKQGVQAGGQTPLNRS